MADDPVEEIQRYLQTVAAVSERLQGAGDQLDGEERAFDELEDQMEAHGEGFYRDVREFNEHVVQEGEQALKQVQELVESLRQTWSNELHQGTEEVGHEVQETEQHARQVEEQLHEHHGRLQEQGFDEVRQGHEELTQSVHELESSTEQSFGELLQGLGEMAGNARTMHAETLHQFQESVSHLTGHVTETAHQAFNDMKEAVEHTATSAVSSAFGELQNEFSHVFNAFGSTADEVGTHLMNSGQEIFDEMVAHTRDHASEKLKGEVEKAIGEAIEGLITEFGESIAMMGVGAATTTAISPFVPELVVAKNVAKVVNDVIETLSFGLG